MDGHVSGKDEADWVRRCLVYEVEGAWSRARAKKTWKELVDSDLKVFPFAFFPTLRWWLTWMWYSSGDDLPECGTRQCPLTVKHILVECVDLKDVRNKKMYEINTLLLLPLKIYLIILKHIKTLILLKKLVFISNFNVFILMFVICFFILA